MEGFNKRLQKAQTRHHSEREHAAEQGMEQQHPPRPNTSDGQQRKHTTTSGHTPPSRRAPPPPQDKLCRMSSKEDSAVSANGRNKHVTGSPYRKPVRPAPVPPGGKRHPSFSGGHQEVPFSPTSLGDGMTTPTLLSRPSSSYPPVGTGVFTQQTYGTELDRESYGIMISRPHVIADLNILRMDMEPSTSGVEEAQSPRSYDSNSLLLTQKVSSSLPELLDETGKSAGPKTLEQAEHGKEGTNGSVSPSHNYSHTRHLSLLGGIKKEGGGGGGRRSRKLRSRSPPNLPPPPPPPTNPMEGLPETTQDHDSMASPGFSKVLHTISDIDQQLDNITENFTTSTVITLSQPPSHPPPLPPTDMDAAIVSCGQPDLGPSHLPQGQDRVDGFCEEDWMCDVPPDQADQSDSSSRSHDKRPLEQVIPPHVDGSSNLTNGMAVQNPDKTEQHVMFRDDVEPIPNYEPCVDQAEKENNGETEVPVGVAAIKMRLFGSREKEPTRYKKDGVLSPKSTHPENMTFSNEYFDTSPVNGHHYDNPHYDPTPTESTHCDHNGNVLAQANANNNNSEGESALVSELIFSDTRMMEGQNQPTNDSCPVSPETVVDEAGVRQHNPKRNLYDDPWDEKPISKHKEIGVVRRTLPPPGVQGLVNKKTTPPVIPPRSQGQEKEKSPSPMAPKRSSIVQSMQFAEVYVKETPRPFATEVRNVLSLERNLLKKGVLPLSPPTSTATQLSPPSPDTHLSSPSGSLDNRESSLLASISNTLQETSLYGSDSLLNKGETSSQYSGSEQTPPLTPTTRQTKITSRGELEKIRAAYRKDPTNPAISPCSSSMSISPTQMRTSSQHSVSQMDSAPSSVNSSPYLSRGSATGRAKQQHNGRVAVPLDGLTRDTKVTYNAPTQGRILRSLV